jgi:hypothetical protein
MYLGIVLNLVQQDVIGTAALSQLAGVKLDRISPFPFRVRTPLGQVVSPVQPAPRLPGKAGEKAQLRRKRRAA